MFLTNGLLERLVWQLNVDKNRTCSHLYLLKTLYLLLVVIVIPFNCNYLSRCTHYFSVVVIKHHEQSSLQSLFGLMVTEGKVHNGRVKAAGKHELP